MSTNDIMSELIDDLEFCIEGDLKAYEAGERSSFVLMRYVPEVGMVVPHCWIEIYLPSHQAKWDKFMYGQSITLAGVFPRDVLRFLAALRLDYAD